jgi:hypothetical protein
MNFIDWRDLLSRRFNIPKTQSMRKVIRSFSMTEKALFYSLTTIPLKLRPFVEG